MASPTSVTLWRNHIRKKGNSGTLFQPFSAQKMSKTKD
jgi:hypothetical protein